MGPASFYRPRNPRATPLWKLAETHYERLSRAWSKKPREARQFTRRGVRCEMLFPGFLAAGLVWAMLPGPHAFAVGVFFTSCVVVAGIFGGLTANRSILVVQALPGAIAQGLVLAAN